MAHEDLGISDLTIYPKQEIKKILETSTKNQNDKVRITALVNAKEARVKATIQRVEQTESHNYRLKHNNELLRKQVESLSKKVTQLESREGERESRGRRVPDVEVRTLQLQLAQAEQTERRLRDEIGRNEERNLCLLRRKEALMESMREELESMRERMNKGAGKNYNQSGVQDEEIEGDRELIQSLRDEVKRLKNKLENRDVTLATSQMQLERDKNNLLNQIEELKTVNKKLEQEAQQFKRRAGLLEEKVTQLRLDNEHFRADIEGDESFLCGDGVGDSGTEFGSPSVPGEEDVLSVKLGEEGGYVRFEGLERQRSRTEGVGLVSRFQKDKGEVKRHKTVAVSKEGRQS